MNFMRVSDGRLPSFMLESFYGIIIRLAAKGAMPEDTNDVLEDGRMSDLYREILIQRKTPFGNKILKGVLIGLTVFLIIAGILLHPIIMLVGVAVGLASWFFAIPKLEVEYEYLYVNGELDIDAIYSKQKRKRIASYDMQELEILAPEKSHALDCYKNQQETKVKDFTSGDLDAKAYILVMNKENKREMVKVELDDVILNDIRRIAPRKVNLL